MSSATPPGVVVDHELAAAGRFVGSPAIVILPNGDYVASHDFFGPKSGQSVSATTRIFRSIDRGANWRLSAEVKDQFWSNLFVHRGQVYLMGTTYEYGRIAMRRSGDGEVWSEPAYLTTETGYHTAPVPVVEHGGRLWRAMEYHPPGPWGAFQAFLISAKSGADLMKAASWSMTEKLAFPSHAAEGKTWLEGNAVVGPKGSMLDILRVDNIEKAALVSVRGNRLQFEKLVALPGGAKKFVIRYDAKSRAYWTMSNPALPEYEASASNPASVRNTLVLMKSSDLEHWTKVRTVLSHPDPEKHAFQYIDWQFDGEDIVAVSRTAFDDSAGGADRAHDANFLTFHRVSRFRTN